MKKTLIDAYNLAGGNKTVDIELPGMPAYSVQAVWSGLTGTKNGTIKLQQSIDGTNFDQLKALDSTGTETDFGISLTATPGSASLEDKFGFSGNVLRVAVAVGSITGGTLTVYLLTK